MKKPYRDFICFSIAKRNQEYKASYASKLHKIILKMQS